MLQLYQASESLRAEIDKQIRARKFRIAQLDVPKGDLPFYLLIKGFWQGYYPACGRDRGAPGAFNHQLECTGNPAALFIYTIPEIVHHRLSGSWTPWHGRDRLPRYPTIGEVDMVAAWETASQLTADGKYTDFKVFQPQIEKHLRAVA